AAKWGGMSGSRRVAALTIAAAAALVLPIAPVLAGPKAPAPCSAPTAPDEWPTFGRDLANSRTQDEAGGIDTTTAPLLTKRWAFSTGGAATGTADLNGTP